MNSSQAVTGRKLWWLTRASKEELEEALATYRGPHGGSLTRSQVREAKNFYDYVYCNVREDPPENFDSSDSSEDEDEDDPNDPEWVPSLHHRRSMRRLVQQEVDDDDQAADVKEEPNDEGELGIERIDSEDEASNDDDAADVKEEPQDEMELDQAVDPKKEPEDDEERVDPAADVKEEPEDPWTMRDRPPFVIRGDDGKPDADIQFDENFLPGPDGKGIIF